MKWLKPISGLFIETKKDETQRFLGHWHGQTEEETKNGSRSYMLTMEIEKIKDGDISGKIKMTYPEIHRRDVTVEVSGTVVNIKYLQLQYNNADPQVTQFGSIILEVNADSSQLEGFFIGFGFEDGALRRGTVKAKRLY